MQRYIDKSCHTLYVYKITDHTLHSDNFYRRPFIDRVNYSVTYISGVTLKKNSGCLQHVFLHSLTKSIFISMVNLINSFNMEKQPCS